MKTSTLVLGYLGLAWPAMADPTWPSDIDELEEIMYQITSFRSRKFADNIFPCTTEASGPGRRNAAEWLRAAFHDMSTANTYFKIGGLDGSLQYELDNGENTGQGHRDTMDFMGPYYTSRSSLSDLIAVGVYMSVRSCGGPDGPIIPIRPGRIDAVQAGPPGVPQPQNTASTFKQQFDRMGFTVEEMIQVTACGHTIGGVHSVEFPELMPPTGVVDGNAPLDSTDTIFDTNVVTEYLSGNTTNPLVVGPSVKIKKNSDFKVFNVDGNKTMSGLADPSTFKAVCQKTLQKMIEVVPDGVTLGEPIAPYSVKPVNLQLTLVAGGFGLRLTGYIRVRTTGLPAVRDIVLTYKDRKGYQCLPGLCTFVSTVQGIGKGFDDSFSFYPLEAYISAESGISSFTVTVDYMDGTSEFHDNNGHGYPLQDDILFQSPQSCVLGSSGALTVVAAVRNDVVGKGAQARISYKTAQTKSPLGLLAFDTMPLEQGACVGKYTFFSLNYTIKSPYPYETRIDVTAGDKADTFKPVSDLGGTCSTFAHAALCDGGEAPRSSIAAAATSADAVVSSASASASAAAAAAAAAAADAASSPAGTAVSAPVRRSTVGGYKRVSCRDEEGFGARALSDVFFVQDAMTLDKCARLCSGYVYWGTDYGRECYCGNALDQSSAGALIQDCHMLCGGDSDEDCGGGNRLGLYSTTIERVAPTSTATPQHKPTVSSFGLVGCWTEGRGVRALSGAALAQDDMTNEVCADWCKDYEYFGTEYGRECYCGSKLAASSLAAPASECSTPCAGSNADYCGAGTRLSLYKKKRSLAAKSWRILKRNKGQ